MTHNNSHKILRVRAIGCEWIFSFVIFRYSHYYYIRDTSVCNVLSRNTNIMNKWAKANNIIRVYNITCRLCVVFRTVNGRQIRLRRRRGRPKMDKWRWPAGTVGQRRTMTPLHQWTALIAAVLVISGHVASAQSLCDTPQCECDDSQSQVRCSCRKVPHESQVNSNQFNHKKYLDINVK